MDKTGVKIDPVTGRPAELIRKEQDDKDNREQEALLREQAAWMAVSKTEAGAKLVSLVMQQLTKRIEKLVEEDPEAAAYSMILKEMGIRESRAKAASKELFQRYVKEE
jgi:hypothetical protein